VVICLERGANLHMAQLMPVPLTVSCFSQIQIGCTFLVPADPVSPGQGPLNGFVCCCMHGFIVVIVAVECSSIIVTVFQLFALIIGCAVELCVCVCRMISILMNIILLGLFNVSALCGCYNYTFL